MIMAGCAAEVLPPASQPIDPAVLTPEAAHEAWARVLKSGVDWRGRVDFKKIALQPGDLYFYIAYVARNSPKNHPELFPTLEDRLAYYLNSYNALAMYGIILSGFPTDFDGFWDRAGFFKFNKFVVGGEEISLYDYENEVIRPLGDPRVHFALNCMTVSCPVLPRVPFEGKILHKQLNDVARRFINNPGNVQPIEAGGIIRLSEIFKFYEKDFVNPRTAPSLLAFINRYLDQKVPESLKVEFIPYDWAVNSS